MNKNLMHLQFVAQVDVGPDADFDFGDRFILK